MGKKIIGFCISQKIGIKNFLKWLINKCLKGTHIRYENSGGSAHYELLCGY